MCKNKSFFPSSFKRKENKISQAENRKFPTLFASSCYYHID